MINLNLTEFEIQKSIVRYLELRKILYFAIPNGELRSKATGAKLKRMGVKAGVPDLFICHPSRDSYGLFLEIKSSSGRLSQQQTVWFDELEARNYRVEIVRSLDEAIEIVRAYLR